MHRRRAGVAAVAEARWNVINIAVTLGGNPARRPERFGECSMPAACWILTLFCRFGTHQPGRPPKTPRRLERSVKTMAKFLYARGRARFFCPRNDGHPTHLGTFTGAEALETCPPVQVPRR